LGAKEDPVYFLELMRAVFLTPLRAFSRFLFTTSFSRKDLWS
jgi:hypothetical protein